MTDIILITGKLGVGKTTMLKHILENEGKGTGVIINEFASVGVDGSFVDNDDMTIAEINNGCVCCSKSGDMKKIVKKLQEEYKVDKIFLETTGVATIKPTLEAISKVGTVKKIVTVMDVKAYNDAGKFGPVSKQQIKYSTTIVLNKTDLASPSKMIKDIRNINSNVQIIRTSFGKLDINDLKEGGFTPSKEEKGVIQTLFPELYQDKATKHLNKSGTKSIVFKPTKPINKDRFETYLQNLPRHIPRAKGYINTGNKTYSFNYSQGIYTFQEEKGKPVIVLIGQLSLKDKLQQRYLLGKTHQEPRLLIQ